MKRGVEVHQTGTIRLKPGQMTATCTVNRVDAGRSIVTMMMDDPGYDVRLTCESDDRGWTVIGIAAHRDMASAADQIDVKFELTTYRVRQGIGK